MNGESECVDLKKKGDTNVAFLLCFNQVRGSLRLEKKTYGSEKLLQ